MHECVSWQAVFNASVLRNKQRLCKSDICADTFKGLEESFSVRRNVFTERALIGEVSHRLVRQQQMLTSVLQRRLPSDCLHPGSSTSDALSLLHISYWRPIVNVEPSGRHILIT